MRDHRVLHAQAQRHLALMLHRRMSRLHPFTRRQTRTSARLGPWSINIRLPRTSCVSEDLHRSTLSVPWKSLNTLIIHVVSWTVVRSLSRYVVTTLFRLIASTLRCISALPSLVDIYFSPRLHEHPSPISSQSSWRRMSCGSMPAELTPIRNTSTRRSWTYSFVPTNG